MLVKGLPNLTEAIGQRIVQGAPKMLDRMKKNTVVEYNRKNVSQ